MDAQSQPAPPLPQTVFDIVAMVLRCDAASLSSTTHLFNDLHVDSLNALEILIELEDAFAIEIGTDDAKKMQTLADVVALVTRMRAQPAQ
ncbi:acyl carrier protein [Paraburkholderia caballeronis]|uniref:Acyl carrier protein/NADH dehydrogenase (Ubiquinone) 1 alpha/beta subcomplex 1 n=1 Tax=Paraburkholderia caballeronis TaxID=416943 RepID=A0A1H7LAP7_9BURK|nr:acyl carrier protein [Paraburkholderia caballeronis]PXW28359.1 acyl carrier protein [Paraburkholderia caballeronis]PXX03725.1 acyl carrier protein [Paraburkholderia caballeronis]RAK04469.1 acyl carrier protein [Paraburkholderia caballeronis]SED78904.1 acyl carrier protein/NADH dehydrogenase (ubiquinone) 1 alpha/beta subcomplex 1 [Paraburkholderia caballeronis]SEK95585.1 acyl carrier protein/NADH dehydrogenase (ubiquinone) 1 alpha/beta subcomplex 1 [Paraburkholderia caballeronis]